MKKRILSWILICLFCLLLPAAALADEEAPAGEPAAAEETATEEPAAAEAPAAVEEAASGEAAAPEADGEPQPEEVVLTGSQEPEEPAGGEAGSGDPTTEPSPVILPTVSVAQGDAGDLFDDLNSDGAYAHMAQFHITNNTQVVIDSFQIPISRQMESNGFDWTNTDYAFYLVNADGVPVETEVTVGVAIYLFDAGLEPGDTWAVLYWNGESEPDSPQASWEPRYTPMTPELQDVFDRAMEGREDAAWYAPRSLTAVQTADGTSYVFEAGITEDYPYGYSTDFYGSAGPVYYITVHEDTEGNCEVVRIEEPMYEPGADPEPPDVPASSEEPGGDGKTSADDDGGKTDGKTESKTDGKSGGSTNSGKSGGGNGEPKTGDEAPIGIWAAVIVLCGTAAAAVLPVLKRR